MFQPDVVRRLCGFSCPIPFAHDYVYERGARIYMIRGSLAQLSQEAAYGEGHATEADGQEETR